GSAAAPYLCLQLELDQLQLADLIVQTRRPLARQAQPRRGIFVGRVDTPLADGLLRLARLLDTPRDITLLAPMIKRELHYRLLTGPHGEAIAQFAQAGSQMQRIAAAITRLKQDYHRPVRVEDLASAVG